MEKSPLQVNDNEGNIEMLLRTAFSVNQLSVYGAVADLCKKWDNKSSEDATEDSSEDSESSGTHYAKQMQQSLMPIRPQHQQRQRQDQQFEGGANFDYCVDRKIGWRYYRGSRRNPQAASSSSTSQWQTSRWQTSWSSWQPTASGDCGFLEGTPENRRGCRQDTHSQDTSVQYSLFTSAERTSRAWLKGQHGSRIALSSLCA